MYVKNVNDCFSFIITIQAEYNTALLVVNCNQNLLISQTFFAQGNPHKNFLFKVSPDKTES